MNTLMQDIENEPRWCRECPSLKEWNTIKLGNVITLGKDTVKVVHIGEVDGYIHFRSQLPSGARLTHMVKFFSEDIKRHVRENRLKKLLKK